MFQTASSAFKNKDIRKRILFTLGMLFIFRFGSAIVVPNVNTAALLAGTADNSLLGMMNLLGGGAIERLSIFALGVGPYITASIVIQLLSMDVIPHFTELSKSGQAGRKTLDKYTRYLAVMLCFLQGATMIYAFELSYNVLINNSLSSYLYVVILLTAGTMFLLWLGDQISQKGIGNGMSLLIFAGIVSGLPWQFSNAFKTLVDTSSSSATFNGLLSFGLYILVYLAIIVLVIFMQTAVRKIPIQYTTSATNARRNDMTYLPLKINSASVIPVIFASAVMITPVTIASYFPENEITLAMSNLLSLQKPVGLALYVVLIVAFTFFYTKLQVDPEKIAENLSKSGTYIPGIRPGTETKNYINKVLNRITVLGAIFISFIAVLPYIIPMITNLPSSMALGGTGIIIVVGVAMETVAQIKGQMTQKSYRGFVQR
ncbi:MAG: preprotein translocase subunit SecY [Erysipelotrichaceae bacterium]